MFKLGEDVRNEASEDRATKDLLRALAIWKYVTTSMVVALLISACLMLGSESGFRIRDLLLGLAGSALAAVALSLYYDVFMRRQQSLEAKLQSAALLKDYAFNILGSRAAEVLSSEGAVRLLTSLLKRPDVIRELAVAAGATGSAERDSLSDYLKPLVTPPRFTKVSVNNRLTLSTTSEDAYMWSCRERFILDKSVNSFRILVTDSNDTAIALCRDQRIDCLILLSARTGGVEKWVREHLNVEGHANTEGRGRPVRIELHSLDSAVSASDMANNFRLLEARIVDDGVETVVTLHFDQELSLIDPYFYWATDSYMYVEEILIDYHGIVGHPLVNSVSVLSFCASPLLRITHDKSRCVVRADVGALLAAGEGMQIIWRKQ